MARENIVLTEDEMKAIENEGPTEHRLRWQEIVLFQMYTGLVTRHPGIRFQQIQESERANGSTRESASRLGVAYVSSLLPPAVAVLEKYGWTVPKIDNADYNHH